MKLTDADAPDLDPGDWNAFRVDAHRALDGMIDFLNTIRERRVWSDPAPVRDRFQQPMPRTGRLLKDVLADVEQKIMPFSTGNLHPAFMGWVHGAGTPVGMVAEMLASGLNMNCGGRNHVGIEVERQIERWVREAFDFPPTSAGLFVNGTSMANLLGVLIARQHALGAQIRCSGLQGQPRLCAYASAAAHGCIARALETAGIGSDQLRRVPCDENGAMRIPTLASLIMEDRKAGLRPFLIVGTAGTVDIGAIDPLEALAEIAASEGLWFHIDGAFGALGALSPRLKPLLAGLERADSIAFDFHKWGQVPYDAGYILVRDGAAQLATFGAAHAYLSRAETGLAAGDVWPCDLGLDLSRGFRALKVWMTFEVFGADGLSATIEKACYLASRLERALHRSTRFRLAAPVPLNIVCFRPMTANPGEDSRRIVEHLHAQGSAAPSVTIIDGQAAIRSAINNHRTQPIDIDQYMNDLNDAFDFITAQPDQRLVDAA